MADQNRPWRRQGEDFWRAHHEAWKRSDLNQRQYCEAQGIPLKAFGNWRAQLKAEAQRREFTRWCGAAAWPVTADPFAPPRLGSRTGNSHHAGQNIKHLGSA